MKLGHVVAVLLLLLGAFAQEVPVEGPSEVPEGPEEPLPVPSCPVYPSCLSVNAERAPPDNLGVVAFWAMDDEVNATYAAEYVLANNATVSSVQVGFGGEGFLCGAAEFALPLSALSAGQNAAYDNVSHSISFWVNPANYSIGMFAPLVSLESAAFNAIGYGVHLSEAQLEACNTNVFYGQGNPLGDSQYSTSQLEDCIRYGITGPGTVLPLNQWTHVVAASERFGELGTVGGSNLLSMYINGTLVFSANLTGAGATTEVRSGPVNMGSILGAGSENNFTQFFGMLDEVMLHDHALTADEVRVLYQWFAELKVCAEQPEGPETPGEAPELPEGPETPDGPIPEVPEVPEIPDVPGVPESEANTIPLPPPITT